MYFSITELQLKITNSYAISIRHHLQSQQETTNKVYLFYFVKFQDTSIKAVYTEYDCYTVESFILSNGALFDIISWYRGGMLVTILPTFM